MTFSEATDKVDHGRKRERFIFPKIIQHDLLDRLFPAKGLPDPELFRREPQRWITGFQARDGDGYVERQGGYWMFQPR